MADDVIDKITNYNVGQGISSFINEYISYLLYGLVGVGIFIYLYTYMKNKQIYKFRVQAKKRRGNSAPETVFYKAGYVKDKNGNSLFRVKIGRFKSKDLDKLPDTRFMDGNTFHYQIKDPDTWVQTRVIDLERNIIKRRLRLLVNYGGFMAGQEGLQFQDVAEQMVESGIAEYSDNGDYEVITVTDEVYEPIPSDIKAITIAKLQNAATALGTNINKQIAIYTIGLVIMAVAFIVGYYFLTSRGGTA